MTTNPSRPASDEPEPVEGSSHAAETTEHVDPPSPDTVPPKEPSAEAASAEPDDAAGGNAAKPEGEAKTDTHVGAVSAESAPSAESSEPPSSETDSTPEPAVTEPAPATEPPRFASEDQTPIAPPQAPEPPAEQSTEVLSAAAPAPEPDLIPGMKEETPHHHHYARHEAARDRVWPHLIWELLLAVGVAVLLLVYRHQDWHHFHSLGYTPVWWWSVMLGLLSMGFALSLRVGVPNLGVGLFFVSGGVLASTFYHERDWDAWPSIAAAVGVALVAGLLLGTIVSVLHVPAWAASLGAGLAAYGWAAHSLNQDQSRILSPSDGPNLYHWWGWIFLGVAALSVIGGAFGAISVLRKSWGVAAKSDPAGHPGVGGVFATLGGLAVSSALAAGAGGLLWLGMRAVPAPGAGHTLLNPGSDVMNAIMQSNALVVLILATVLLGGVSAFGRRGGIFGTTLATMVMVLLVATSVFDFKGVFSYIYLVGGALLLGLIVTRVLEAVGRVTDDPLEHEEHIAPGSNLESLRSRGW